MRHTARSTRSGDLRTLTGRRGHQRAARPRATAPRRVAIPRALALRRLLVEAEASGIVIHADAEAQRLLDWTARQKGADPRGYHAVTIGSDIFVRPEHAGNVRILREEMIHVSQQRAGASSGDIVKAEIDAREKMIQHRRAWGITETEALEMRREIHTMRQTGRY